jgi:uncharacterized protein (DUF4213/DUF364 family)
MIVEELKDRWWKRVVEKGLQGETVTIHVKALKPEQAIGNPMRTDYALLKGHEVMIQADLKGAYGQAFTDEPMDYVGSLASIRDLLLVSSRERALLVATVNATYSHLGLITGTRHCRDSGPEECGKEMATELARMFPSVAKVVMIGYQPAIMHYVSKAFRDFRITDMDPSNIGKVIEGVEIESHAHNADAIAWSDLVLATGSTLVNRTLEDIVESGEGKKLVFFGVTLAAAAYEFGFDRLCFEAL